MTSPSHYNGIVVIDKLAGMTSHDVVHQARKLFRTKRVGHTGTLDPDATGVLVLCLGQATRLAEYLSAARKHYVTEVVFGIETDTQDASGATTAVQDASHLTEADICALLPRFRGTIWQIPPMVSAIHHEGRRLYELAREGIEVERAAREVRIDTLELTAFTAGEHPFAGLEVTCSTGTYIRTLAADLGTAAGVGGMMRTLRRTWVGDQAHHFALSEAHTLEALRERGQAGTLAEVLLPSAAALSGWPQARLDAAQEARIRRGQTVPADEVVAATSEATIWTEAADLHQIALLDELGDLIAVARLHAGQLQPTKVFAHESV
jgi:tRNA pseudouridine55 synthase